MNVTTEEPEPRRKGATSCSEGTPKAGIDGLDAACPDEEPPSRGPWPPEVPPTGLLPGMLGEMALCYGACWRHYRSARR